MKIVELEALLGIPRANIRYYEKEKLFTPKRAGNGYREYSEDDAKTLKKIIILRKLGISVQDIRLILEGSVSLQEILTANKARLRAQMDELGGALAVCELMEKNQTKAENFDTEYYWKVIEGREADGQHFMDFLRDYGAHERALFWGFWGSTYWRDENRTTAGWQIGAIAAFLLNFFLIERLITVGRLEDLSFWLSAINLPVMFLELSVLAIPMVLLERKYRGRAAEKAKKGWSLPGVFLFYIGWFITFLAGIPMAMKLLYFDRLKGAKQFYLISSPMFYLYYVLGIAVLMLYPWLFSKKGLFVRRTGGEGLLCCRLPWKIRLRVAEVVGILFALGAVVYMLNYTRFSMDGVVRHRMFWEKTYTWEDVETQSFSYNTDMELCCELQMKDGTRASWNQGIQGIRFDHYPKESELADESDYTYYVVELLHKLGKDSGDSDYREVENVIFCITSLDREQEKLYGTYTDELLPGVTISIDEDTITTNRTARYELSRSETGVTLTIVSERAEEPETYEIVPGKGGIHSFESPEGQGTMVLCSGTDGLGAKVSDFFEGSYLRRDWSENSYDFHEDGTLKIISTQMYGLNSSESLWLEEPTGQGSVAYEDYRYELQDGLLTLYDENGEAVQKFLRESREEYR